MVITGRNVFLHLSLGRRSSRISICRQDRSVKIHPVVMVLPSVSLLKKWHYKLNRVMGARIKTLPRLGHSGRCCIFLLLHREWEHPSSCPWGMRQEIMGFSCSKWDLLQWQKLSRMKYCIRLLMEVVAPPSSWVFKTRLEKHLSGVISVELLLPWGTEVG